MKIVAFGASNTRNSINKALARFTATLVPHAQTEVLDLNDFDLPIFSEDLEKEIGLPQAAGVHPLQGVTDGAQRLDIGPFADRSIRVPAAWQTELQTARRAHPI